MTAAKSGKDDWFGKRRHYFVRRLLDQSLHLIQDFQAAYCRYSASCIRERPGEQRNLEPNAAQRAILHHVGRMVGTETGKGPLWRLKDHCRQLWPRNAPHPPAQEACIDWLIGALFHETMRLRDTLYVLDNDDRLPWNDRTASPNSPRDGHPGSFQQQIERIAALFSRLRDELRLLIPDLLANPLVLRLLAEQEEIVADLWGESLESFFDDLFSGNAASGFCLIGASYASGQWFSQALTMYERALNRDRQCNEARIRVAHLRAIVREEDETTECARQAIRNFTEGVKGHGN